MHRMRPIALSLVVALLCGLASPLFAQPAGPPRVSPMAWVSQMVGLTKIDVNYSRPSVNDRQVFGELEPYGKVWRLGANEATTFTTSTEIQVEGKKLPAGEYGLFAIPGKDKWTVIFNEVADQWGAFGYEEEKDVLRVEVEPQKADHQEQFEIELEDVTDTGAVVSFHWRETRVPVEIAVDTHQLALEKAREEASGGGRAAWNWANYFYQNDIHTETALAWAEAGAAANEMYWTVSLAARLQSKAGKPKEAKANAQKALELAAADESQGARFVHQDAELLKEEMSSW